MADEFVCAREVSVFTDRQRPRLVEIATRGCTNSSIRDEEVVSRHIAGGYSYRESHTADSITKNRFIFWRINDNILELTEQSLDVSLTGHVLMLRFSGGNLLPTVSIFETTANVCILVATTSSVHRIVFPHPERLHKHGLGMASSSSEITLPSIFNVNSMPELQEPWNLAVFSAHAVTATGWLCQDGHALFALATAVGSILLVKLPQPGNHDEAEQFELRQSSVMQRLWTGLVPTSLRGESPDADGALDLCLQPLGKQMCIFSLCRDHKLRIWSCQKQECIAVKELLEDVPDDIDSQTTAAHNHSMRKTVDSVTGKVYLGIHLCFPYHNQFCIYEALSSGQEVSVVPVSFMYLQTQMGHLVDFTLTPNHIWTTWTTTDGETVTMFNNIEGGTTSSAGWQKVATSSIHSNVAVPVHREPREVFLEEIFYPGRYMDQTIVKAIQIYQATPSLSPGLAPNQSRLDLQEQVINLIDADIQLSAPDGDLMYEEYYELQLRCWEKFHSYVIQYHEAGCTPLGLFVDQRTGLVGLVRKDLLSIVRPCDAVERLGLMPSQVESECFLQGPFAEEDKSHREALALFCRALGLVSKMITVENCSAIENDLQYQCDPAATARNIAISLLSNISDDDQQQMDGSNFSDFAQDIETRLHEVPNLFSCLDCVLRSVDLSGMLPNTAEGSPGWMRNSQAGYRNLFSSPSMISVLCLSFQQMTHTRMSLCRDLLILLTILERLGSRAYSDPKRSQDICTIYIPHTVTLLKCYHSLHWITQQKVSPAPSNAVESNLKQLAALEITDGMQARPEFDNPSRTLLETFLFTNGGPQLRYTMSRMQSESTMSFGVLLNRAMYALTGLLWPTNPNVMFPEFLLSNYQYMHLQAYCDLIDSWCQACQSYRLFLCGQSYLLGGEHHKAHDCFVRAAEGIGSEDGLMQMLLQSDTQDASRLVVLFYVKVMRLFEQFDVPDMVINVATTAVSMAEPDDPNIPNLWSNIFKHHLELGHNDDAYAALTSNPDPSRRRDCLHRFMVVLCERGQLQELCEYPYVNLQDEFVGIMESHARTVDISTHRYYDLLYAFHVFRGNHRKAGNVMYEYGGRLGRELPGKAGLQKQAKCYLAAMNALRLVDPLNAWIVTPWDRAKKNDEAPNMSPKRKQGDEESWYGENRPKPRRKLTVMEIGDLEREYLLVLARLQLLKMDADPSQATGPALTPQETQALLIQAGLFDTAFTIANTFNLPSDAIFEGLASRCVKQSYLSTGIARNGAIEDDGSWDWILANDTGNAQFARDKSVADQAWQLLQYYLNKLGSHEGRFYHRCVASKLLSMGTPLPTWLVNDFKCLNPSELLHLYVTFDMLQEAADLAMEYISAVLGEGKEHFGLKTALHATMPSVWLPYTTIDHLLAALQDAPAHSTLSKARDDLVEKLKHYQGQVERVSEAMTAAAWKRAQRKQNASMLPWQ